MILSGSVREGEMMPSVRSFAEQVGANPLTVAKAYQPLLECGVLVSRRGVGLFVAHGGESRLREIEKARFLSDEWPEIRAHIERLGLDSDELVQEALSRPR